MSEKTYLVHHVRNLSPRTFVLRFDRNGLEFRPGQHVFVGLAGHLDLREYTVYSSPGDGFLEILIREIEGGRVSPALRRCRPGDRLDVRGPFGRFTIDEEDLRGRRLLFIAGGTGISPYHCFALSYPGLDYRVLHGVRFLSELYDREVFARERFTSCITREDGGDYRGRVTEYLREQPVEEGSLCYLCGSCDLIYETYAILLSRDIPPDHIFTEVYY